MIILSVEKESKTCSRKEFPNIYPNLTMLKLLFSGILLITMFPLQLSLAVDDIEPPTLSELMNCTDSYTILNPNKITFRIGVDVFRQDKVSTVWFPTNTK